VNQLAHRRRAELERLLAAAEELRRAQVGGSGDFAAAAGAERDAVRALTRAAGDLLAEAGRPATDATLDRVASTLRAAAADDDARGQLVRGVLARDVEATGFGTLLGSMPAPAPRREPSRAEDERARGRERAQAEKAVVRARARSEDLERRAAAAEEAAAEARAKAAEAAAELARSERRLREPLAP
jgi:hypothetical protein